MKKNLVKLLSICQEFQDKSKSRLWLKDRLRDAIASLSLFTQKEKAELYKTAFDLAVSGTPTKVTVSAGSGTVTVMNGTDYSSPGVCKPLVQKMGKLERHAGARERTVESKDQIQRSRAKSVIFYVCSKHVAPAKDHKDWQGKIYVDRFWRAILKSTDREWMIPQVERYIVENDVKTIQWVMGPPVWLTTRPFCRHWFAPVLTSTVLTRDPDYYTPVTHGKKTKRGATYDYIKKNLAKR